MATYEEDLSRALARRDSALKSATAALENAGNGVKKNVERLEDGLNVNKAIAAHPWAVAGVALGAGLIVSRLLASPGSSAHPPAHVVVEVRNNGGEVTAKAAEPKHRSPMDFIMQVIAGFETVQAMLRQFQDSTRHRAEAESNSQAGEPGAEPAAPSQQAPSAPLS